MPGGALDWIARELAALEEKGLRRSLEPLGPAQGPVVELGGRPLVNLCSNDYLGFAEDPGLARRLSTLRVEELGAAGSRLIRGELALYERVEHGGALSPVVAPEPSDAL